MDKRRRTIIIVSVIIIGIVGGGFASFFAARSRLAKQPIPSLAVPTSQEPVSNASATPQTVWNDPLGFTFNYPQSFRLNAHEEDQENYAHIELTLPGKEGSIVIWAKDPPAGTLASWIATAMNSTEQVPLIDSQLGGQVGKKAVQNGDPTHMMVASLYDDLLFVVDMTHPQKDAQEWLAYFDAVTSSFTHASSQESGGESVGVSYDEEEVIE